MVNKEVKIDSQLTAMAGGFLTAGKLLKRGYHVSLTIRNGKAVDLFVHNPKTNRAFSVRVKSLMRKNCFPIKRERIVDSYVYVFVVLNPNSPVEDYFILKGQTILEDVGKFFGASYKRAKPSPVPAINLGPLKPFRDDWSLFDEA